MGRDILTYDDLLQIIELIKKLLPDERAEVVAFLLKDDGAIAESRASYSGEMRSSERKLRTIPQAEAERIADGVFDRHSELFRKLAQ